MITPREKVRATFQSALANTGPGVEFAGAVDLAIEQTARELGLSVEAVEYALIEAEHA